MLYDQEGYPFLPQPTEDVLGFVSQPDSSVLVLYNYYTIVDILLKSGLTPSEAIVFFKKKEDYPIKLDQGI